VEDCHPFFLIRTWTLNNRYTGWTTAQEVLSSSSFVSDILAVGDDDAPTKIESKIKTKRAVMMMRSLEELDMDDLKMVGCSVSLPGRA
jgi:hypothetical protein